MTTPHHRSSLIAVASCAVLALLGACSSDEKPDEGGTETTAETVSDLEKATEEMNKADIVDMTGQAEVVVEARDNFFEPKYLEVKKGTTVTYRNDGRNVHNVLPVEEGAFTPIEADVFDPGATGQITFDEAGEFPYYCSLHGSRTKGMIGGVRVVE